MTDSVVSYTIVMPAACATQQYTFHNCSTLHHIDPIRAVCKNIQSRKLVICTKFQSTIVLAMLDNGDPLEEEHSRGCCFDALFSSLRVVAKSEGSCSIFGRPTARSVMWSACAADPFSCYILVYFTSLLCSLLLFLFISLIFHSAQMCAITRAPRALRLSQVPQRGSDCNVVCFSRFISLFFSHSAFWPCRSHRKTKFRRQCAREPSTLHAPCAGASRACFRSRRARISNLQ